MKNYLAVFTGSSTGKKAKKWGALSKKERNERERLGMMGWGEWIKANQKSIVDTGAPLGGTKKVDENGVKKITNALCAYVVVRAKSHADAAKLFRNHPHFTTFPGDAVEIMECYPIPERIG